MHNLVVQCEQDFGKKLSVLQYIWRAFFDQGLAGFLFEDGGGDGAEADTAVPRLLL